MNIGKASKNCGLPSKTIRYYEEIGLVQPLRGANGYRDYSETDVHQLKFLQRARRLGFSIEECRDLLSLYQDTGRASADVKALTEAKLSEVDKKIAELQALKTTLSRLAEACQGNERPDCPIIDDLAGGPR
ncbi:Cu(I)-responsive transcriptional regulator [Roseibium denhamense]|uniref:Cu(I)-responsive transcriptional regulator n=1 Tax=Roseibium denhamense TaxID=76305 RepID=A0ABY1PJN5_9HYPH|nr:Cu(I)-responsive transcriptional regulator [Roseibium denhamense]MTI05541.1 Cu(I)-responsive transcriptional regulator [Roseibium denhamense]SMP35132.1 Cu(I)-responsive transcriptional regulator [Roseibium denhamense]